MRMALMIMEIAFVLKDFTSKFMRTPQWSSTTTSISTKVGLFFLQQVELVCETVQP